MVKKNCLFPGHIHYVAAKTEDTKRKLIEEAIKIKWKEQGGVVAKDVEQYTEKELRLAQELE